MQAACTNPAFFSKRCPLRRTARFFPDSPLLFAETLNPLIFGLLRAIP
jgi:hypothetical protein